MDPLKDLPWNKTVPVFSKKSSGFMVAGCVLTYPVAKKRLEGVCFCSCLCAIVRLQTPTSQYHLQSMLSIFRVTW